MNTVFLGNYSKRNASNDQSIYSKQIASYNRRSYPKQTAYCNTITELVLNVLNVIRDINKMLHIIYLLQYYQIIHLNKILHIMRKIILNKLPNIMREIISREKTLTIREISIKIWLSFPMLFLIIRAFAGIISCARHIYYEKMSTIGVKKI